MAVRERLRPGRRSRFHPRTRSWHPVHLLAGGLRARLRVLRDRRPGLQPQPRRRRDRRSGMAGEPGTAAPGQRRGRFRGHECRLHGHGRAAGQLSQCRAGAAAADIRSRLRPVPPPGDREYLRHRAAHRPAGRGVQRVAGGLAARARRRAARRTRADQPHAPDRRTAGCLLALRGQPCQPLHHFRIRHARGRERLSRSGRRSGTPARGTACQGQPDTLQSLLRHDVRAFRHGDDRGIPGAPAREGPGRHDTEDPGRRYRGSLRPIGW